MMGFKMIYWTPMSGLYFLYDYIWKNVDIFGKKNLGRYGRIGEILHRRIWPDWGL